MTNWIQRKGVRLLKDNFISFTAICGGTFLLIVIPKFLGLSWVEVSGIVFAVWAFGFTVFQILKSNSSDEKTSLKELGDEFKSLINETRDEFSKKDKIHDDDLKSIRQETSLLPIIIQEHYRIKDEISGVLRDIEQLSAALAQALKYAEILKRQNNLEKILKDEKTKSYDLLLELLRRIEVLEKSKDTGKPKAPIPTTRRSPIKETRPPRQVNSKKRKQ